MMEDKKVAKLFLSAVMGEKVVELDFLPQELTIRIPEDKIKKQEGEKEKEEDQDENLHLTVCSFDFFAKIELANGKGFKTAIIELQKAHWETDIMRFRRDIDYHYQILQDTYGENDETVLQIYCIFILSHGINIPNVPVVEVYPVIKDHTLNKQVEGKNELLNSPPHRSWIIQINQLKNHCRDELEQLLNIFVQENRTQNHHILNVKEEDFPKEYRSIINRLRMAGESEQIQAEMELEDDIIKERHS
jgi:hypothetical protein